MNEADSIRLQRELLLRGIFPQMPGGAHARLAELSVEYWLEPGEQLFAIGESSDRFCFLIEGEMMLEAPHQAGWSVSAVGIVGIIDTLLERPRARSCRALTRSRLFSVDATSWFDMIEDNSHMARAMIRNFARQMRTRWPGALASPQHGSASFPPSPPLQPPRTTYDKIIALRRARLLSRAGMQALASLADLAEPIELDAGQPLFREGHEHSNLYIVVSGSIELRQAPDFRSVHGPGDLVGGAGALCRDLFEASAVATSDASVLRIPEQEYYDRAEEHGGITRGALAYIVSELEARLAAPGAM